MRKINAKLFLALLLGSVVTTGAVFGVHHFQYGRIADSLLWQARHAEERGDVKRQARYLQRYLEFNPKDLAEKAHLAQLWSGDAFADAPRQRLKAVRLLDEVLTIGDDSPELRRLLVKLALEVQQLKLAHSHLEKLLGKTFLTSPEEEAGAKAGTERGESEGYAGQLLEAESQPAKALICYRLAVGHAPQIQTNYVRLAELLRKQKELDPQQIKTNQREADRLLDKLVESNALSSEAYLLRWRYRRQFGLLNLRAEAVAGQVALKDAANDVAQALQRAPESVDVLLAAADLERLEGQAVFALVKPEDREKRLSEHRDKALAYLNQGLKLHARGGRSAAADLTQYQLLWQKADLLLDDIERLDALSNAAEPGKGAERRQAWSAEVTQTIEQMRKTRGSPTAADYLKARLLVLDRHWADAVVLFEQVRPTLGTQADLGNQINRYLGQCYEQLVEPGQMYKAYERLSQSQTNSVSALLGMAQAEWSMGHLDKAAERYRQLALSGQMPDKVWLDYTRLEIQRQGQQETPDWKVADNLLETAKKANPKSIDVPLLAALLAIAQGPTVEKARDVLKQAQAEQAWQNNLDLWTARIYLELRDNRREEARRILEEAKRTQGEQVLLLLAEARLLANGKGAEPAINRLADKLVKFSSEDEQGRLLSGLADVQLNLENVQAARELWRRVAKMPSRRTDLSLHLLLFDLAVKADDEDDMRQTLADIRNVEGRQGPFHRYGEALRLIWRAKKLPAEERPKVLDEARVHLDRVQSLRPTWAPLLLARARVDQLSDRPDLAIGHLQEAIQNGERSPAVIRDLVELLTSAERYQEADAALGYLREPALVNSALGRLAEYVAFQRKDTRRMLELMRKNRPSAGAKDYREVLWEARMLAAANQPEAEPKLREALKLGDKEPEPYVALVQFLARQKREKEADAVLEQARQRLPADRVELTLGQCYEALGRKKSAQARYEQALTNHPKDATVVRRVAGFYWNTGQVLEAEPLLRDLVEKRVQKPTAEDVSWARWHLALVLAGGTDHGRFREALQLVGLKLDGNGQLIRETDKLADSTDTRRFQARVLAAQAGHRQFRQRSLELLEELERNKALRPDDRFVLALIYEAEGAWGKAKPILRELVSEREPAPRHLAYYVQALLEHKELEEAAKMADRLEELETERGAGPNAYAAIELRARLLEEQGKGDAGIRLLKDHIKRPAAKPEEVLLLLNSLRRQKKLADAFALCSATWTEKKCPSEVIGGASVAVLRNMQSIGAPATNAQVLLIEEHLKEAIKANPKSMVLLLHLADLYDQRGRWEEAEAMYREVLRPDNEPKNIIALNNLAWLLAQRSSDPHKVQEALTKIESAVNGIGRRADLLDTRGLVYLKLGQESAALADFREASADMPTPSHLFHLARAHYQARDKIAAFKVFKQAKENGLQASSLHPVEQESYQRLLEELKIR